MFGSGKASIMAGMRSNNGVPSAALMAAVLSSSLAGFGAIAAPVSASAAQAVARAAVMGNDKQMALNGIMAIENATEAIAEGEKTGVSATQAAATAVARWPSVRAGFVRIRASATELAKVDAAIAALGRDVTTRHDLRRDANEVTGFIAPLFARAGDRVPADVHELDYLGRSVTLDVAGGDWARARRDGERLRDRWNAVRGAVRARRNGMNAAMSFDRAVSSLERAIAARNVDATRAAATGIGNGVDALEKVFA